MSSSTTNNSGFATDVAKLASGTIFAQALGVIVSSLLARLYAPEVFGIAALFTSITAVIGVVSCLRYETTIMLPDTDEEAANLLIVSLLSACLISLLSVFTVWSGGPLIATLLQSPKLLPYLWLAPFAIFLQGVFLALNYWNSRTRHFGRLSIARITSSVSMSLGKLGAGFANYAIGSSLIMANIFGAFISTSTLSGQIYRQGQWADWGDQSPKPRFVPLGTKGSAQPQTGRPHSHQGPPQRSRLALPLALVRLDVC